MAVMDVKVTALEAQNLICPFTGEKLEVHMTVQPGSVTFSAPNAFTLNEPVASMDELVRRTTMRNGVSGVLAPNDATVCPYTGRKLRLRTLPDGRVCYVGGFNPRAACPSLGNFIYQASMRDGKTDLHDPDKFIVENGSKKNRTAKAHDISVSDDTMKAAEEITEKTGLYKKTVRGASLGRKH